MIRLGLMIIGTVAATLMAMAENPPRQPNVILMMADDLGYGDLSCYGSEKLRTPRLDKMATEGVRLTQFYSGNTVCTPSRMALLTGAYPPRLGWQGGVLGYGISGKNGLSGEAVTIAEVFKGAGYATGICGKWHLGNEDAFQPMKQGFDFTYYIKMSNNQGKVLWRGDKIEADPFDNRRLSEWFARESIAFIEKNREKPFFLYLPFTAPHFPAQAHPDWKGRSALQDYGDVVEELDARVGLILDALKRLDLDEHTIVVFTSDNGTEKGQRRWGSAKPYRGLKWTTLEGGYRVPCIVRAPGRLTAGRVHSKLSAAVDLFPSLAEAAGVSIGPAVAGAQKIDGVNLWPSWAGNSAAHARKDMLYWNGWGALQAIRKGDWKLYLDEVPDIAGSDAGAVLVKPEQDPEERVNLAAKYPEKVAELLSLAKRQVADVQAHALPLGGPEPQKRREGPLGKWMKP